MPELSLEDFHYFPKVTFSILFFTFLNWKIVSRFYYFSHSRSVNYVDSLKRCSRVLQTKQFCYNVRIQIFPKKNMTKFLSFFHAKFPYIDVFTMFTGELSKIISLCMVCLNVEIFHILREEIYGPETNQNNYCFELEIFSGFSLGAYIFFLSYDVFIIMISIFP